MTTVVRAKRAKKTRAQAAPISLPESEAKAAAATTVPSGDETVELFPHGISVGSAIGRPVFILKDKAGVDVLPVWMNPLDAGVALAELSMTSGTSPHAVTKRVLEMNGIKLESCTFTEVVGHHQFAELAFNGGPETAARLRVRADEAISFCLQARARFYSTRAIMARCRALDADLSSFESNLNQGLLPGLKLEIENSSKKHPYVM